MWFSAHSTVALAWQRGRFFCLSTTLLCPVWVHAQLTDDGGVGRSTPAGQTADDRVSHWAFQPLSQPTLPTVSQHNGMVNGLDAFVFQRLESNGLVFSPPAAKRHLLRRIYFDLTGLPPSVTEAEAFLADSSVNAYEKLIDRLLASPHYGERWARHWLDLVRFGQTNGYCRDNEKPESWRYRDYVIRALNDDKPYDQFILEQLAGDELDTPSEESLVATGYYRLEMCVAN